MAKLKIHDDHLHGSTSLVPQHPKQDIEVILPDDDGALLSKDNLSSFSLESSMAAGFILKPKGLIKPIENPEAFDGFLTVHDYETSPTFEGEHTCTEWLISNDEKFETIIIHYKETKKENLLSWRPSVEATGLKVFVKYRFLSNDIASIWSDVISYTTPTGRIQTPVLDIINNTYTVTLSTSVMKINGILENTYHKSTSYKIYKKDTKEVVWEKTTEEPKELIKIEVPEGILKPRYEYTVEVLHYTNKRDIFSLPVIKDFIPTFYGIFAPELKYDPIASAIVTDTKVSYLDRLRRTEWCIYGVMKTSPEWKETLLIKTSDNYKDLQYAKNDEYIYSKLFLDKYLSTEDIKDSKFDTFKVTCQYIGNEYDSPVAEMILNKGMVLDNIRDMTCKLTRSAEHALPILDYTFRTNTFFIDSTTGATQNDLDLITKKDLTKVIAVMSDNKEIDFTKFSKITGVANNTGSNSSINVRITITPEVIKVCNHLGYPEPLFTDVLYGSKNTIKQFKLIYFVQGLSGTRKKTLDLFLQNGNEYVALFPTNHKPAYANPIISFTRLEHKFIDIKVECAKVNSQTWIKGTKFDFYIYDKVSGVLVHEFSRPYTDFINGQSVMFDLQEVIDAKSMKPKLDYQIKCVQHTDWLSFESRVVDFVYPPIPIKPPVIEVNGLAKKQVITITNDPFVDSPLEPWNFTNIRIVKSDGTVVHNTRVPNEFVSYQIPWDCLELNTDYTVIMSITSLDTTSEEGRQIFHVGNVTTDFKELKLYDKGIINYYTPIGEVKEYKIVGANDEGSGISYIDIEYWQGEKKVTGGKVSIKKSEERFVIGGEKLKMALKPDNTYTVKVRVGSDWYPASVWKSYTVKTCKEIIETADGMKDLGSGNWVDGGVFGSVDRKYIAPTSAEFDHQIALREYCGEWGDETQFRSVDLSKYDMGATVVEEYNNSFKQVTGKTNNRINKDYFAELNVPGFKAEGVDNHWSYKVGDRVSFKGKLYEALVDQNWLEFRPDQNPTKWKEIVKDLLLPSEVEIMDNMGINWNIDDTKMTVKPIGTATVDLRVSDPGIISDINKYAGWTKMLSPTTKEIVYISTKPFVKNISFNDICGRHKEYAYFNRMTFRFGTQLYYVRFATEAEMVVLNDYCKLAKVNTPTLKDDKTYDNEINVPTFLECGKKIPTNIFAYGNHDEITGTPNTLRKGNIAKFKRVGGFRVVITPIDEADAPYNFIGQNIPHPHMRIPFDTQFVYDKFTDTGFLGVIKPFMNFEELTAELGLAGSFKKVSKLEAKDKDPYNLWVARYYHGLISIESMSAIGYEAKRNILSQLGLIYGYDNGRGHIEPKDFSLEGTRYTFELATNMRRNNMVFDTSKTTKSYNFWRNPNVKRKFDHFGKSYHSEYLRTLYVDNTNIKGFGWYHSSDYRYHHYTTLGKHYTTSNPKITMDDARFNTIGRFFFKNRIYQNNENLGNGWIILGKDNVLRENINEFSELDYYTYITHNVIFNNDSRAHIYGWRPVMVADLDLNPKSLSWDDEDDVTNPKIVNKFDSNGTLTQQPLKQYMIDNINTRSIREDVVAICEKAGQMVNTKYKIFVNSRYPHYTDYRLEELAQVSLVLMRGYLPIQKRPIYICFTSKAQQLFRELSKFGLDAKKYLDQVVWIDDLKMLKEVKVDKNNKDWINKTEFSSIADKLLVNHFKTNLFDSANQIRLYSSFNSSDYNYYDFNLTGYLADTDRYRIADGAYSIIQHMNLYYNYDHYLLFPDDFSLRSRMILTSELREVLTSIKTSFYNEGYESIIDTISDTEQDFYRLYNIEKISKFISSIILVDDMDLGFSLDRFKFKEYDPDYNKYIDLDSILNYDFKVGLLPIQTFIKNYIYLRGFSQYQNDNNAGSRAVKYGTVKSKTLLTKFDNFSKIDTGYFLVSKNYSVANNEGGFISLEYFDQLDKLPNPGLLYSYVKVKEDKLVYTNQLDSAINKILADALSVHNYGTSILSFQSATDRKPLASQYNRFILFSAFGVKELIINYYRVQNYVDNMYEALINLIPEFKRLENDLINNDRVNKVKYFTDYLFKKLLDQSVCLDISQHEDLHADKMVYVSDYESIGELDNKDSFYDYLLARYKTEYKLNAKYTGSKIWLSKFRSNLKKCKTVLRNDVFDLEHNLSGKWVDYAWYIAEAEKRYENKLKKNNKNLLTVAESKLSDVETDVHVLNLYPNDKLFNPTNLNVETTPVTHIINKEFPYKKPIMIRLENQTVNNISYMLDGDLYTYDIEANQLFETNASEYIKNGLVPDEITSYGDKCITNRVTAFTYLTNKMFNTFRIAKRDEINVDAIKKLNIQLASHRIIFNPEGKEQLELLNSLKAIESILSKISPDARFATIYSLTNYASNLNIIPIQMADDFLWYIEDIINYWEELKPLKTGITSTNISQDVKNWIGNNLLKTAMVKCVVNGTDIHFDKLSKEKYKDYLDSVKWLDQTNDIIDTYYKDQIVTLDIPAPTDTDKNTKENIYVDADFYKGNFLFKPYKDFVEYPVGTVGNELGKVLNVQKDYVLVSKVMAEFLSNLTSGLKFDINLIKGIDCVIENTYYDPNKPVCRWLIDKGIIELKEITIGTEVYKFLVAEIRFIDYIMSIDNSSVFNYIIWVNKDNYGEYVHGITEFLSYSRMRADKLGNKFIQNIEKDSFKIYNGSIEGIVYDITNTDNTVNINTNLKLVDQVTVKTETNEVLILDKDGVYTKPTSSTGSSMINPGTVLEFVTDGQMRTVTFKDGVNEVYGLVDQKLLYPWNFTAEQEKDIYKYGGGVRTYVGVWGYQPNGLMFSTLTGNNERRYGMGERVSIKGKPWELYEALKTQNYDEFNPETTPSAWKKITHDTKLPTPRELLMTMGVSINLMAYEATTSNVGAVSGKQAVGDVKSNTISFVKMKSPTTGKTCYITHEPILTCSKNHIVTTDNDYLIPRSTTIRFGTRLYYVYVSTFEEINLLDKFRKSKTLPGLAGKVMLSNVRNDTATTEVFLNGAKGTATAIEDTGLCITLEPIKEAEAPYHKALNSVPGLVLPNVINGTNAYVLNNYNPWTDDGCYGITNDAVLTNTANSVVGKFRKESAPTTSEWIMWYKNGKVLYYPKTSIYTYKAVSGNDPYTIKNFLEQGLIYNGSCGDNYVFRGNFSNGTCKYKMSSPNYFNSNVYMCNVNADDRPVSYYQNIGGLIMRSINTTNGTKSNHITRVYGSGLASGNVIQYFGESFDFLSINDMKSLGFGLTGFPALTNFIGRSVLTVEASKLRPTLRQDYITGLISRGINLEKPQIVSDIVFRPIISTYLNDVSMYNDGGGQLTSTVKDLVVNDYISAGNQSLRYHLSMDSRTGNYTVEIGVESNTSSAKRFCPDNKELMLLLLFYNIAYDEGIIIPSEKILNIVDFEGARKCQYITGHHSSFSIIDNSFSGPTMEKHNQLLCNDTLQLNFKNHIRTLIEANKCNSYEEMEAGIYQYLSLIINNRTFLTFFVTEWNKIIGFGTSAPLYLDTSGKISLRLSGYDDSDLNNIEWGLNYMGYRQVEKIFNDITKPIPFGLSRNAAGFNTLLTLFSSSGFVIDGSIDKKILPETDNGGGI